MTRKGSPSGDPDDGPTHDGNEQSDTVHDDPGEAPSEPTPSNDSGADSDDRDPDAELRAFLREAAISVLIVAMIGAVLYGVTGVWPPMVAVQSGSMEPHLERGDLVVVSEPGRYVPSEARADTGVVTYQTGRETGYRTFGNYGSVIVYAPPDRGGSPVIHRARFWVDRGENWYDEANASHHSADSCEELSHCPAPHAGFITKGDSNPGYDQVMGIGSGPVRPAWIVGVGHLRIPLLGYVRLGLVTMGEVPSGQTVDVAAAERGETIQAAANASVRANATG